MENLRHFYLYSRYNSVDIKYKLGMPDYSYKFVENYFCKSLSRLGKVTEVSTVDELPADFSEHEFLFVFEPPHEIPSGYARWAIPVFAWEYSSIPDEVLGGEERLDWKNVLTSVRGAVTHSSFTVKSMEDAGIDVPKTYILAPLFDQFSIFADVPKSRLWSLPFEGLYWDSKEKVGTGAGRTAQSELSFSEVVYTYVFNPVDGRKRWEDAVSAFVFTHRKNCDAVFVLKLINKNEEKSLRTVRAFINRLGDFECRLVIICGFLADEDFGELVRGTDFAVNTSCGEGQCLPLIEFMSAGTPSVSPRHTAMADYVNSSNSLVVEHSWNLSSWPNDPLKKYRCFNYPVKWESLVAMFTSSYQLITESPEDYRSMSVAAYETMKNQCSQEVVEKSLLKFIESLSPK